MNQPRKMPVGETGTVQIPCSKKDSLRGGSEATPAETMKFTVFKSVSDTGKGEIYDDWDSFTEALVELSIRKTKREYLPLLKLAEFGNRPNNKGNLRHTDNIKTLYGIEGDYDGEVMPLEEAVNRLQGAGVNCVVYPTWSYTEDKPRWRVLAPLSVPVRYNLDTTHAEMVSRLNGVLGGVLAPESWTLGQNYYFGWQEGVTYPAARVLDGEFIDTLEALEAGAVGQPLASKSQGAERMRGGRGAGGTEEVFAAKVAALGRKMHKGDGRREMLLSYITSKSAQYGCDRESLRAMVDGIQSKYFDEPFDETNINEIIEWAVGKDSELPVQYVASFGGVTLATNKSRIPYSNLNNAVMLLEHNPELKGRIWYDEFLSSVLTNWQGPVRKWTDADSTKLAVYMQREFRLHSISSGLAHEAAMCAAFHNVRNECREYMDSLSWDGRERLPRLLLDNFGAERNSYTEAVGRCWFVSMVARVYEPGCQVDTVPVFEGEQGARKSTALRVIGGKWFTELHESVMTKDFLMVLDGNLLVEIAEMHSFSKAEVNRIKGVISNRVDRYRKPFARLATDNKRQTVFACTTNESDWNHDSTGARRFWPIACGEINVVALERDRDQLFAEAVARYKRGESWWDVPQREHKAQTDARYNEHPWQMSVEEYLARNELSEVTINQLLENALHLDINRYNPSHAKIVGSILRRVGWEKVSTTVLSNGKTGRCWRKKL